MSNRMIIITNIFIHDYPLISSKDYQFKNLIIDEMPDDAILEMVADNLAATRSYEGTLAEYTQERWMEMDEQLF